MRRASPHRTRPGSSLTERGSPLSNRRRRCEGAREFPGNLLLTPSYARLRSFLKLMVRPARTFQPSDDAITTSAWAGGSLPVYGFRAGPASDDFRNALAQLSTTVIGGPASKGRLFRRKCWPSAVTS